MAELLKLLNVAPADSPRYTNTWGDAFVAVFDSATTAAEYALDISEGLRTYDWRSVGLIRPPMLRVAIDAPVDIRRVLFPRADQPMGLHGFGGLSVTVVDVPVANVRRTGRCPR